MGEEMAPYLIGGAGLGQQHQSKRVTLAPLEVQGAGNLEAVPDLASAQDHLAKAEAAAQAQGRDANHLWTAFGPTNVAIHRVSVAAELGDYQRATALGELPHCVVGSPSRR
jgi:hypothetical protein